MYCLILILVGTKNTDLIRQNFSDPFLFGSTILCTLRQANKKMHYVCFNANPLCTLFVLLSQDFTFMKLFWFQLNILSVFIQVFQLLVSNFHFSSGFLHNSWEKIEQSKCSPHLKQKLAATPKLNSRLCEQVLVTVCQQQAYTCRKQLIISF